MSQLGKRQRSYGSYDSYPSYASLFGKRRGTRKYRPKAVMAKGKMAAMMKVIARREVEKTTELKSIQYNSSVLGLNNYANSTVGNNVVSLTPIGGGIDINQGTASDERIGNQVRVRKVWLHLSLFPAPYNATTNSTPIPQDVICYIFSVRPNEPSDLTSVRTFCDDSFFDNGSSVQGFTGDLSDFMKRPNTDSVIVHKRFVLKIGAANYETNTGTQANSYSYANNDYKLNCLKRMDITKYIPKNLKFEDTSNACQNNPVYLVMSPCDADGGAATDTTNATPLTYTYGLTYEYTDK